jgi:hypothetical protein
MMEGLIQGSTMKKDVQEKFERALAGFRKRQEDVRQRLREREKFETEWTRIRTAVVVPALEEVKALLSNAGWSARSAQKRTKASISRFIGEAYMAKGLTCHFSHKSQKIR